MYGPGLARVYTFGLKQRVEVVHDGHFLRGELLRQEEDHLLMKVGRLFYLYDVIGQQEGSQPYNRLNVVGRCLPADLETP